MEKNTMAYTLLYAIILSVCTNTIIYTGPVEDARNKVQSTDDLIQSNINSIAQSLNAIVETLEKQHSSLQQEKGNLIAKKEEISKGIDTVNSSENKIKTVPLMPENIKSPLSQMFILQKDFLKSLDGTLQKGITSIDALNISLPQVIANFETVLSDIEKYKKIVKDAFDASIKTLNIIVKTEQTSQTVKNEVVKVGTTVGNAIKKEADKAGKALKKFFTTGKI